MKNDEELARLIVDTDKRLREDRAGFENLWSEAAEFTCPRLNDFNTKSQGGQRTRKVYDTTAITALSCWRPRLSVLSPTRRHSGAFCALLMKKIMTILKPISGWRNAPKLS